jgi:hypothetical protein
MSGSDVQSIHSVTLAHAPLDGKSGPLLMRVDSRYVQEGGARPPHVGVLDAPAWNANALELQNPIAATVTTCDPDLPRSRFVMDPEIPVARGTRRIRESREE